MCAGVRYRGTDRLSWHACQLELDLWEHIDRLEQPRRRRLWQLTGTWLQVALVGTLLLIELLCTTTIGSGGI